MNKKDWNRRQNQKKTDLLRAAKNVPCLDCGVEYPHYVMEFDHREDKVGNLGVISYKVGMKRLLEELAKCDVVCANCHKVRTELRRNSGFV